MPRQPDSQTKADEFDSLFHRHPEHVAPFRAERDADADLARLLCDGVTHDP